MANQLRRFQVSTGLALGGIALAVLLTLNLGRTLKRQRVEQEHLRDELRRSEHLAALGKLLAGVAHEVRNPLAGIRSPVQLWERLPDTARLAEVTGVVMPFLNDFLHSRQWRYDSIGLATALAGLGVFLMQTPAGSPPQVSPPNRPFPNPFLER